MATQVTLDATPGDDASNSYCILTEAETYLDGHLDEDVWGSNPEFREAALVAAARQMNMLVYRGKQYSETQALAFPRSVHVSSGSPFIPAEVVNAQVEQALFMLKQMVQGGSSDAREQLIAAGVEEAKIGDLEEKYGPAGKAQTRVSVCERARGYLRPYLAGKVAWGF